MNNRKNLKMIQGIAGIYEESLILPFLPFPKEKRIGLLRKEIAKQINMNPESVSKILQKMKRDGAVRCYKGRWRRA